MQYQTWNDNESLRAALLERLSIALADERLLRGRNTPFGILLDGAPPRDAESILGLPVSLAFVVDGLFLGLPSAWGPEWGHDICHAMKRKTNLNRVVPGVMFVVLKSLSGLIEDQVVRGFASVDAQKQLAVLEDATAVVVSSMSKLLSGHEDEVRTIARLPGNDSVCYIAQAAVEAVLTREVKEPSTLLDTDKEKLRVSRLGNAQATGVQAMSAIRAACQLFVDDAQQHIAAAHPGDVASLRLAEENARTQFFNSMAEAAMGLVIDAPSTSLSVKQRGGGAAGKVTGTRVGRLLRRQAVQPEPVGATIVGQPTRK